MSTTLHQLIAEEEILNISDFRARLAQADSPLPVFKEALHTINTTLDERFKNGEDIRKLIYGRAREVDHLIDIVWHQYDWPQDKIALVAVGGYGRGELHPHSDIDLLILLADDIQAEQHQANISGFLTLLWDINLDIGSSVRTMTECYQEAQKDITIATNLIESRTLAGNKALHSAIYDQVTSEDAWSDKEFFLGKLKEQKDRHQKTNNTEYNLEPNLKNCRGGLRDLQTIGWVAKRHFGSTYIRDLVDDGFLTENELGILNKGELYLWSVRYALHLICKRKEDRLLFDHQRVIAEQFFDYQDKEGKLAVEQFMSKYYRIAMTMSEFNDMLLQHFDEAILRADEEQVIIPINNRFQIHNSFLEVTHDNVFEKQPFALMELFVILAQNPNIQGVRASTIRLVRNNRDKVDETFRHDLRNITLFMELMRSPNGVSTELKRMTRYGILGPYLPKFGRIVGQMQHDLFHIYTVDAHTLKVIQQCRQFRHNDHREEFPIAHRIVNQLPKIELLYIAALFHDIAKGRGGDHSELGAEDVIEFCAMHHLGKWDTHLVSWLVRNHLLMSMTAQRKDISDPEVIHQFAQKVRDVTLLDYLYVLTIADISATNNSLWNSWRATLMRELYTDTKRSLRRGLENPINKEDRIEQTQHEALVLLKRQGTDENTVQALWDNIGDEYFLRETAQSIAEQSKAIIEHSNTDVPLVLIRQTSHRIFEGATEIFIYNLDRQDLFAATVATLDQLHLNIQDARIIVTESGHAIYTYVVLNDDNTALSENPAHMQQIKQRLVEELDDPDDYPEIIQRRVPRQMKLFATPTEVNISNDPIAQQTVIEVITPDRPGLLAKIGLIFSSHNLSVRTAKITSIGERVEDFFFITDSNGLPISESALCEKLQQEICQNLDESLQ